MNNMRILMSAFLIFVASAKADNLGLMLNLEIRTVRSGVVQASLDQGDKTVGNDVEYPVLIGSAGLLNAIPVSVNILRDAIEFDFSKLGSGSFVSADFNGYVLSILDADRARMAFARIDREVTTLAINDEHVSWGEGKVYINVSGLAYGPNTRLRLYFYTVAPKLNIESGGGGIARLSWDIPWVLQVSDDLSQWVDFPTAVSPLSVTFPGGDYRRFYRLRFPVN